MSMSDEEATRLAREADGIMKNPALEQAFESLEGHYIGLWKSSLPSQYELREECHSLLFSLGQIQRQLRNFVETGKLLSAADLEQTSRVDDD